MRRFVVGYTASAVLFLLVAQVVADDQTIIVADGDTLPMVKVGDLVRITQSGAAGRTNIKVDVQGAAKLVSTTNVRKFMNGKPVIGATTKEFLLQATTKGATIITVSTTDTVD